MGSILSQQAARARLLGEGGDMLHARVRPLLTVLPQFSRYTLVSGLALVLDFVIYMLMAAGSTSPAVAGVIGYACGLGLHYLLSVRYVFDPGAAGKAPTRLLAEFVLSGLAGMAITAAVIAVAVELGGLPLLPAKILAVGASFLVVFALRRGVVFASR